MVITQQFTLEGRGFHADRLPPLRRAVLSYPIGKVKVFLQAEHYALLIQKISHLRELRLVVNKVRVTRCS